MKKFHYLLLILFAVSACVSRSEYDELEQKNQTLQNQLEAARVALEEERYSAPKLLREGKDFFDAGNIEQSESKLNLLLLKHPDKRETIEAKKLLTVIGQKKKVLQEDNAWKQADNAEDLSLVNRYLEEYPDGRYLVSAKKKQRFLKEKQQQRAFDDALAANSSTVWKQFLEDYPGHPKTAFIKRKIIQAEVAEIMQGDYGQLPSFTSSYGSYSSTSTVTIENGTEYTLTVRYSGPDVKMVEIPSGATRSVSLVSGSYAIAASVDAASVRNYAGTEQLGGKYSSRFYISRSYY